MTVNHWPPLPMEAWQDTYATLHRWTQIVGKVRLACTPWINHSWHVTLYLSARGLTTSRIVGDGVPFEIEFDFREHVLRIIPAGDAAREIPLRPMAVADFYAAVMAELAAIGVRPSFYPCPNEIEDPIPFAEDRVHSSYDPEAVHRLWIALLDIERVLERFRAGFLGKSSPIHFFWGAFDVAVSRFSGRTAPPHPGGVPALPDYVAREAYSHEVSSAGFWPGGGPTPYPMFYSYIYPEPPGFPDAPIEPEGAFYSPDLREFVLPYDIVRQSPDPDATLLAFLRSTYAAAADLAGWDRAALERPDGWTPRAS